MDLLALIGFPKAIGYEFKAVKRFIDEEQYYLYVKRPGKRSWKIYKDFVNYKLKKVSFGYNRSIELIERWADNPETFEETIENTLVFLKNHSEKKRRTIVKKENVNARKMHRALE